MENYQRFRNLHYKETPLLLGNVWDDKSALLFEQAGYDAIGTSSAAIASSLGYEDGEEMCFEELLLIVKSITAKVSIPLTVDIEAGYSRNTDEIIRNIVTLHNNGVVGINIEDSICINKHRNMQELLNFSHIIKSIKTYLIKNNINLFLNIRTDAYILGLINPKEETIKRIKMYEKSGADGIFVPCLTKEDDIKEIIRFCKTPVNIMAMPDLPKFEILQSLGIKRISMGPFMYTNVQDNMETTIKVIKDNNSFESLFHGNN